MKISISSWFDRQKFIRRVIILLLCSIYFIWSPPAYAAASKPVDSRLEEQVLQIIRQHPEAIVESLTVYQAREYEQQFKAQQAFLQEVSANPSAIIAQSPTLGAETPKIVLLEFSDFQCPYCSKVTQQLKQFVNSHQQEITLVYKNFPLSEIHGEAMLAAKAAWAANQQGKFWQFHDTLFGQQNKLGESLYVSTAKKLNLDLEQFDRDRNSEKASTAIAQDLALGEKIGISGTPFFAMQAVGAPPAQGASFSGLVKTSDLENILARVKNSSTTSAS
ncbi:MAG: thioredoxin domain-containing protein [Cyanosarcina radialis HA8281-LM2]|jgi:protein-disulfide isomerase|nr:thioredoxin domain-containing protein [Cyanosarcina radialis HA8281-LM2]